MCGADGHHAKSPALPRANFIALCLSFPLKAEGWDFSIALSWEQGPSCMFFSLTVQTPHGQGTSPWVSGFLPPCALTAPPVCRGRAQASEAQDKHLGPWAPFPLLWKPAWSLKFSTLSLWLQTLELLQFPDLQTAPPLLRPPPHPHRSCGVVTSAGARSPDSWEHKPRSSTVTLKSALWLECLCHCLPSSACLT